MRFSVLSMALVWLASCAEIPELDRSVSQAALTADYPKLLPTDQLDLGPTDASQERAIQAALLADAQDLQARAEALRQNPAGN